MHQHIVYVQVSYLINNTYTVGNRLYTCTRTCVYTVATLYSSCILQRHITGMLMYNHDCYSTAIAKHLRTCTIYCNVYMYMCSVCTVQCIYNVHVQCIIILYSILYTVYVQCTCMYSVYVLYIVYAVYMYTCTCMCVGLFTTVIHQLLVYMYMQLCLDPHSCAGSWTQS